MNERKPNLYQLRAMLDDLRRIERAANHKGNQLVLLTENIDDTIPDAPLPPWD